jgi:hypothetical protein
MSDRATDTKFRAFCVDLWGETRYRIPIAIAGICDPSSETNAVKHGKNSRTGSDGHLGRCDRV